MATLVTKPFLNVIPYMKRRREFKCADTESVQQISVGYQQGQ